MHFDYGKNIFRIFVILESRHISIYDSVLSVIGQKGCLYCIIAETRECLADESAHFYRIICYTTGFQFIGEIGPCIDCSIMV